MDEIKLTINEKKNINDDDDDDDTCLKFVKSAVTLMRRGSIGIISTQKVFLYFRIAYFFFFFFSLLSFFFYKIEDKGISFLKSFQWRYSRFYFYRRLLASSRPSYTYLMTLEWFRLIFYIVDISYPRLVKKRQVQLKKQKKESLFFN